ncbi:hypothetical protein GLOIN_2v1871470 [Rhizophagus irregularis DAOM 181602=DAOM 197198]|nr:hypothetical protein GLOIN_2v1871470 [Rhizophagus irregularis DAOM 181602=DAOM 197198]
MDDITVKINDDADKIEFDNKIDVDKIDIDKINIDENDVDKIFTFDDGQHNSKPITMIEISPNENYLITYSKEDRSIAGWNVEDMDKVQLKFHQTVRINEDKIHSLCVSDDKELVYNNDGKSYVIDMNNTNKKIALNLDTEVANPKYCHCTFNLKREFILYNDKNKFETKNIGIFSEQTNTSGSSSTSGSSTNKTVKKGLKLGIPIASLDINDDIQLYNFMNHTGLFLLPSLFCTPDKGIKYCWNNKYKSSYNQTLFDEPTTGQTKKQ